MEKFKYKQMKKARRRNESVMAPLRTLHPGTFFPWGEPCNPLKIGIFEDLLNLYPDIGKTRLKFALAAYTSTYRYLWAIASRIPRVDLDGRIVDQISDRNVDAANEKGMQKFPESWGKVITEKAIIALCQAAE
jgi:sRNA-binding protein